MLSCASRMFSRLNISSEHPPQANPHPYRNTTAPGCTKHFGKDGSSAMLHYFVLMEHIPLSGENLEGMGQVLG